MNLWTRIGMASVVATIGACSAAAEDGTASAAAASTTQWRAAIRCEGAVLDVDVDERRNLQFVISDPNAVHALVGGVDLRGRHPQVNAKGEFIFQGRVDRGVFHAWDFTSAQLTNGADVGGYVVLARLYPWDFTTGAPDDIEIHFGEYTEWRFRDCHGEMK